MERNYEGMEEREGNIRGVNGSLGDIREERELKFREILGREGEVRLGRC